jgi:hypothetical protein
MEDMVMRKMLTLFCLLAGTSLAASFEQFELVDKQQPITGGYRSVKVSPMREQSSSDPIRLVGSVFPNYVKETNFWTETVTGSGVVTGKIGKLEITTGATADSTAQYTSFRKARYVSGAALFYRGVHRYTSTSVTSNMCGFGACDATAGAGFCLSNGTFYAVTKKTGAMTAYPASSFTTAFTIDTNSHTYEVWWTNSKVWWYVDDILRYSQSYPVDPPFEQGGKNVLLYNHNYGGGTNSQTLENRVASIYSFGQLSTESHYKHISGAGTWVMKLSGGRLHSIAINTPGTLMTIYDETSAVAGSQMAIIDTTKATGNVGNMNFDCPFFVGLTIVTTGAGDFTVIYE